MKQLKVMREIHRQGGDDAVRDWYANLKPIEQEALGKQITAMLTDVQIYWKSIIPLLRVAFETATEAINDWASAMQDLKRIGVIGEE